MMRGLAYLLCGLLLWTYGRVSDESSGRPIGSGGLVDAGLLGFADFAGDRSSDTGIYGHKKAAGEELFVGGICQQFIGWTVFAAG